MKKKEIMVGLVIIMMVSLIIGIVKGVQYEGMTELLSIPQEEIEKKTIDVLHIAQNQANNSITEFETHIKKIEKPIKQMLKEHPKTKGFLKRILNTILR